jgi:hypothetical protein
VPSDPAQAQIVPVPPRPFPERLRDPDLLPVKRHPSDAAAIVWGAVLLIGIPWMCWRVLKRRRERSASSA